MGGAMNILPPDYEKERHQFSHIRMDKITKIPQTRIQTLYISISSKSSKGYEHVMQNHSSKCPVDGQKYVDGDHKQNESENTDETNDDKIKKALKSVWLLIREYYGYIIVGLVFSSGV